MVAVSVRVTVTFDAVAPSIDFIQCAVIVVSLVGEKLVSIFVPLSYHPSST